MLFHTKGELFPSPLLIFEICAEQEMEFDQKKHFLYVELGHYHQRLARLTKEQQYNAWGHHIVSAQDPKMGK